MTFLDLIEIIYNNNINCLFNLDKRRLKDFFLAICGLQINNFFQTNKKNTINEN